MKQQKIQNTNKGITLIALVITIIVMLILVAVTISMAVNGGLFEYAGRATGEMQKAIDEEQKLANGGIKVGDTWYESIDDYLNGKKPAEHGWTRDGDTFTCEHCNKTYTMGEVVNYTASGTTTLYMDRLGYPDEEENEVEITSQNTEWVVLGIEDTDGDTVYETLLITSEEPLNVKDSETGLPLYGAAAYNNGPSEINRICKALYSNSEYGEARGMTIEDVNRALKFEPLGGLYNYGSGYKTAGNLTTRLDELTEKIDEEKTVWENIVENGTKTPDPNDEDTEEDLGAYEVNGYAYGLASELQLTNMVNEELTTITEIERDTIFGPNVEGYMYVLALRGVAADSGYAVFGPGLVFGGYAYSFYSYFDCCAGDVFEFAVPVRPVVTLTSKLPDKK